MRPMRWTTCLVIAGLLVACDDAGTDPQTPDAEASPKVERELQTITFEDIGYVGYFQCANGGEGELMEWRGMLTFNRTIMDTPSGIQQRTNRFGFSGLPAEHPLYMGPDYVLIGLTSGDAWALDDKHSKIEEKRHNFADGSWGYHQTQNLKLYREDGERLHAVGIIQLKMVDGEWKMNRVGGTCPDS